MLNPALAEMAVRDRIDELQRARAKRSFGTQSYLAADTTRSQTPGSPARHARRAHSRRAIGWFLVSLGLRIALPRRRAGSSR